jgi:23S rRNA pseudouridine1911/1915/1917 synthase
MNISEIIELTALAEDEGMRLDAFISSSTDYSRNSIQILIESGLATVNEKIVAKNYRLRNGDYIRVSIPEPEYANIVPEDIPLDIVYEDRDLLVVNKPKGMVVHPANGNYTGTLVNALMYHCKDSLSGINGEIRPGIVHRIDKDTSGLLVVAKNDTAHEHLSSQLKEHSMLRVYSAIVYGSIREDGTVDAPIGRHPTDRKKFTVTERNSKNAVTHYKITEKLYGFTLIECRLETGRTHQIRVHMAYIGHPLRGDPVYGPKKVITELHGQALHAGTLGFVHPRSGEFISFTSQPPEEFESFVNKHRLH